MTRTTPHARAFTLSLVVGMLAGCTTLGPLLAPRASTEASNMMSGAVSKDAAMTGGGGYTSPGGAPEQQWTGLKGGEVDDNADFDRYLAYLAAYQGGNVKKVDVSQRYQLRVLDQASKSVPNASVTITLGDETLYTTRTTSSGRSLFFPRAFPRGATGDYLVSVAKGSTVATCSLSREASGSLELALPMQRGAIAPKVDICFALDVTGSMGDELGQIQKTIRDLSARIKGLQGAPAVRFGLVAFRDRGSAFVTKPYDFTDNLDVFQARLDGLAASEGGDYPEAVNEALTSATHGLSWATDESLRLMFVIGDAPPHLDYDQDIPYSTTMFQAAGKGIKIFPLAASGLDSQGEYVFRQLAQVTNGKFLFITYGGTTPHNVGTVQENNLDDLVVGIVQTELQNQE